MTLIIANTKLNRLFILFILCLFSTAKAQQLITFDSIPGRTPSDKYQCRVRPICSNIWENTFVLQTYSQASNNNGYVGDLENWSASWIAFEFEGTEVVVEISKIDGTPIQSAMVRPVGVASPAFIENGKAYVTFSAHANVNVDIDGQLEDNYTGMFYNGPAVHSISLFGNPVFEVPEINSSNVLYLNPGTPIPVNLGAYDTVYFAPGVHNIGTPYIIQTNKTLFIPGDAVVHGTIHPPSGWGAAHSWSVYGSGTISGENIPHPSVGTLDGDSSKVFTGATSNIRLEGFVVADPAHHTFNIINNNFGDTTQKNIYKNLKILGWRLNSDGLNAFTNSEVSDCFFRCQDDVFYLGDGVKISNCVTWVDYNGAVLRLHGGGTFSDIRTIYHRNHWHYYGFGGNVIRADFSEGQNISNLTISNIIVEDPKPSLPAIHFEIGSDSNATNPTTFNNVLIEKIIQINRGTPNAWGDNAFYTPQNVLKGANNNGTISNITFKNCYYDGQWINSFATGDFLVNNFVNNVTFQLDDTLTIFPTVYNGSINGEIANIPQSPIVTALGPTTFFEGDSVTLTSNVGSNIVWFPTIETDSIITVSTTGLYSVLYTNEIGCSSISNEINVVVNPLTVSNEQLEKTPDNYIFPNPSNTLLNVVCNHKNAKSIQVINGYGQIVLESKSSNTIDVSNISGGVFYIRIISNDNTVILTEKFVKQ